MNLASRALLSKHTNRKYAILEFERHCIGVSAAYAIVCITCP